MKEATTKKLFPLRWPLGPSILNNLTQPICHFIPNGYLTIIISPLLKFHVQCVMIICYLEENLMDVLIFTKGYCGLYHAI